MVNAGTELFQLMAPHRGTRHLHIHF